MSKNQLQQALLLHHLQREVKRQCDFALKAFQELEEAVILYKDILDRLPHEDIHDEGVVEGSEEYYVKLAQNRKEEQEAENLIGRRSTDIWFHIQNLLISVGNISKLLWPGRPVSGSMSSTREKLRASRSSPEVILLVYSNAGLGAGSSGRLSTRIDQVLHPLRAPSMNKPTVS